MTLEKCGTVGVINVCGQRYEVACQLEFHEGNHLRCCLAKEGYFVTIFWGVIENLPLLRTEEKNDTSPKSCSAFFSEPTALKLRSRLVIKQQSAEEDGVLKQNGAHFQCKLKVGHEGDHHCEGVTEKGEYWFTKWPDIKRPFY